LQRIVRIVSEETHDPKAETESISMSAWDEDYIDEEEQATSSSTRKEAASSTSGTSTLSHRAGAGVG
jgi:hypothetical protein